MNDTFAYLFTFARFPFSLRRFLQRQLTLKEAKQTTSVRMAQREETFLRIVKRSVYSYLRSPYLALLKNADCTFSDLQASIKSKGLEGTLRDLRQAGVYVTYEEFKGRRPIVRDRLTLPVKARDFDNPFVGPDMSMRTGGSTGLGTHIAHNLEYVTAAIHHQCLMLDAYGMTGAPGAVWSAILPGTGLNFVVRRLHQREPILHWFSPIGWRDAKQWLKYDIALFYMLFWLRVFRTEVPTPQIIRHDQAIVVARWMSDTLQQHGRCILYTSVSQAVRICNAAEQAGLDIRGGVIRLHGEPATPAKIHVMQSAGVRPLPHYGSVETGSIAIGCPHATEPDDAHLLSDGFALITHPVLVQGTEITVPSFNLTTLFDQSAKIMLNYQTDDYGIVETRDCGCSLAEYGYTTHVREIRSYSKLVGEAVTLIGNEMVQILEEILPTHFGGSPLDYQWMEAEDEHSFTRLYLLISPRVDITDEQRVIEVIHDAMRSSSSMADAALTTWQQTKTIQIKRMEPIPTARGKLLPLHIERSRDA